MRIDFANYIPDRQVWMEPIGIRRWLAGCCILNGPLRYFSTFFRSIFLWQRLLFLFSYNQFFFFLSLLNRPILRLFYLSIDLFRPISQSVRPDRLASAIYYRMSHSSHHINITSIITLPIRYIIASTLADQRNRYTIEMGNRRIKAYTYNITVLYTNT